MDLIKTGIGLTKTIKNVNRFREILTVFARHGFDELIVNTKLDVLIPNFVIPKSRFIKEENLSEYDLWRSVGYRLRKSFEELGPSFIKLGQLLSTREDIFDPTFIAELKILQNKARGIPFENAIKQIEKSLGRPYKEVFSHIDESPIGLASIGVVYKAKLNSGEDVVLKVRRPAIKRHLKTDFEIISFIISQLERTSKEIRYLGVSRAIEDFFKSIMLETNFIVEAQNNKKLSENLKQIDDEEIFVIPKVYRDLSSERLLVMEYLLGVPFNEIKNISENPDLEDRLIKGVKLFLHNMMVDGFFHADLHGGNFYKLNNGQIGLLDFGLVGVLSKKNRNNLIAILYALLSNNYENLVVEFLDVAEYNTIPDYDSLVKDIKDALLPYVGMTAQELDATQLTYSIVSTLSKHEIYLPREWFIIFRAIMTLDGVGKSLNIDLDIFAIIDSEIKEIMGDVFSKDALLEDSMWLGRDIVGSMRVFPRHLSWMLKEFAKRKYIVHHEVQGLNQEIHTVSKSIFFLGLMILASTLFFSGIFMARNVAISQLQDIPLMSFICWGMSVLVLVRSSVVFKFK